MLRRVGKAGPRPSTAAARASVVAVALMTPRCRLTLDGVDAGPRGAEPSHAAPAPRVVVAPADAGVERAQPAPAAEPTPADVPVARPAGPLLEHHPVDIPADQEPLPTVPAAQRPIGYNVPPSAPAR